jgi:ABC-type proline/glycine betaine transport system permease subunit
VTVLAAERAQRAGWAPSPWTLVWLAAFALVGLLYARPATLPWAADYPAVAIVPFAEWIGAFMTFLKVNLTWLTRTLTAILDVPLQFAMGLLAKGFKLGIGNDAVLLPRLSWVGVTGVTALIGWYLGGRSLALLSGGTFLFIALFGQWNSAMLTLALILICIPICVLVGLFIGIWGYRNPAVDRFLISPLLDLMQTMPTFAYLIPMLLLFGSNPVSALLATAIFATPPMVRATMLGLSRVPQEIRDFSDMAGCTPRQQLWRVLIPAARPTLMVGVNQVIMLALNMVIISSMIGAGGLGYDVLVALRRLSVGQAMEAGLAIVVLAIVLDRLSQAAAHRTARAHLTDSDASRRMLVYAAVAFLVLISSAIWPGWINVIGVLVGLGVLAALDLALGQLRTALASGATARLPARQGVDVAGSPAWRRYGPLLLALAILAAATLVGLLHRGFTDVPAAITITSGPLWKAAVDWITINFFDAIEAFRVTLIVWFLNPIRAF